MPSPVDLYGTAYGNFAELALEQVRRDTYGEDFGQSSWVTGDEYRRFARLLELAAADHVLDVGCGSGGPALLLARELGCRVTGVDVNEAGVRAGRTLARQAGLDDTAHFLRADVRGSIEAIQKELTKLEHPEVQIRVLQATVGGITEADVHLADASDAIIIGFNVVPDEGARTLSDERGVQIRRYDIIYQVTADLKAALEGMLKPEQRQVDLGRALVQRTFTISRLYHHESVTFEAVFGRFVNFRLPLSANRIVFAVNGALPSEDVMRERAAKWAPLLAPYGVPIATYPDKLTTDRDWNTAVRPLTDQYSPANLLREKD